MVKVAALNGEGKGSWVLDEMKAIMFDSCLQRPKEEIFEGLSEKGLVMKVENDEEEEGM